MPRAIWKGALSFSLINIPVSLHSARRPAALDLDLLDKRNYAPVGYQRNNKKTGKPVDSENIVKGYQYRKGEYVVLNDEDFRQANVAATQTIDIHAFVDPGAIAERLGIEQIAGPLLHRSLQPGSLRRREADLVAACPHRLRDHAPHRLAEEHLRRRVAEP